MKRILVLLSLLITTPALANDGPSRSPEVLCLDTLDVRQSESIVREIAPRARVQADSQSNCFVLIAQEAKLAQIRAVLHQLEARAQSRRAAR